MAVKVRRKRPDDRVERILKDPQTYFEQARAKARKDIVAELERDRGRMRRRPAV